MSIVSKGVNTSIEVEALSAKGIGIFSDSILQAFK